MRSTFALLSVLVPTAIAWAEPSVPSIPYPRQGVGLGVGVGQFEVLGRLRHRHVVFEPLLGVDVVAVARRDPSTHSAGQDDGRARLDLGSTAGLDVRGLPYVTRRWEIGVIGGVAWQARWRSYEQESPGGTHQHGVAVRAGAGVGFRPGPRTTLGLDFLTDLVQATLSPPTPFGGGAPNPDHRPEVRWAPRATVRLLWTFWTGRSLGDVEE